jgi:hypothetical protein
MDLFADRLNFSWTSHVCNDWSQRKQEISFNLIPSPDKDGIDKSDENILGVEKLQHW